MVNTGWKHPQSMAQDSRNELNNGRRCYPWVNIANVKKNDYSYCDLNPWATSGIDIDHKSPILYGYNYGFNLPSNAVVTKITLFVLVQQLTHTKPKYDPTGKWRYSVSKFESVRLKQGTSTEGLGQGNEFAGKSGSRNLPYKTWSNESQTTFSGTPSEWGLDSKNIIPTINSGDFGIAVQFVGTIKNAWNTPAVAQLKMSIDYDVPKLVDDNPSTFTKITVTHSAGSRTGQEIQFDKNNVSEVIGTVYYGSNVPWQLAFNFYHKGNAGETPIITFTSTSLIMGVNARSYSEGKTSSGKYTMPSIHCEGDKTEKVYKQNFAVFAGILLGEQTINYKINDVLYTLRFNVDAEGMDDETKARFMNRYQQCMMKSCVFMGNQALGMGGANYITSEFYHAENNMYGTSGSYKNIAHNKWNQHGGDGCNNTCWLDKCYSNNNH